jgi:CRISP-associated protein Cas1
MGFLDRFLSTSNFQAAWAKVADNQGCAGVDGETIAQFAEHSEQKLETLRRAVAAGLYQPLPLQQFFVPKKDKSWRTLAVPTVRDRIVQQALLNILHPIFEPQFEESSFAYRPGRSHLMAVRQVAHWHQRGYDWLLDADLVDFFGNVAHPRLLAEVSERLHKNALQTVNRAKSNPLKAQTGLAQMVSGLVSSWIGSGVLTAEGLILPDKGVPQGSVISPILSNVYLDDFDEQIAASPFKLVRYADDFVLMGRNERQLHEAKELVSDLLTEMGLQLHQQKTAVTNFKRGFRFLGHTFVGDLIVKNQTNLEKVVDVTSSRRSP